MSEVLQVVTDGSSIGNPGPGGWAAILTQGKKRWEISGAKHPTTASEMELVAAVEALRAIPIGTRVELHSDCRYLIDGMRFRALRWKRQGWRNRRGAELQHQELWLELLDLNESLQVRWKWIPGHNHHPRQTRADSLAYQEARTLWCELKVAA